MDYNRSNSNISENDKNAFNLKYQIETIGKCLREANKKTNNINRKPLTHDAIKNVNVIGDSSMIKCCEGLSSQDKDIKIVTHPGSMNNDMLDYIKPIIKRKPDVLLMHSSHNDITNNISMVKKVRDLVKYVCNLQSCTKYMGQTLVFI